MNRPIKGDGYRRGQYAHVMFQASACDVPEMKVKINEGSFWVNNRTIVEYGGGQSPLIEAPKSGAKWVLVAINKLGKVTLYNGVPMPNNPEPPKVDKNVLPVAFVFVKSSSRVITNDMIYDARPLYAAGGYPEAHNVLAGREAEDCHPICAISGLQEALDDKISLEDVREEVARKADVDGTTAANFTLNIDDSGTPVEYCGIRVNRGNQPQVGLRFNEDEDMWQYTNDGTNWHAIGGGVGLTDLASYYNAGITQLSCEPENARHPIAVGDNDPRLKEIEKKIGRDELRRDYVSKDDIEKLLSEKADSDAVFNKEDAENIFLTRAEFRQNGGYTKSQLNDFFDAKANVSSVYTRKEVEEKLGNYYNKEDINILLEKIDDKCHCCCGKGSADVDLSDYYTAEQIDELIRHLDEKEYDIDEVDEKVSNLQTAIYDLRNMIGEGGSGTPINTYSKEEIDEKILQVVTSTQHNCKHCEQLSELTNYYTKADVNLLMSDKADINHGHTANQISQDSNHRMVTDDQITAWNNKAESLKYVAENVEKKGVANGYASLDENGKVPVEQLPTMNVGVGKGGVQFVDTYNELLSITEPDTDKIYFVTDASDDSTVDNGWAEYVFAKDAWLKIAEGEALDMELDYNNLKNIPDYFAVDPEILAKYGTIGTAGNVYTKTEVDNLLEGKSDANHNHDGDYITAEGLTTALADYVKTDNEKLHSANQLGSFSVSEANMEDGAVLTYNAEKDALEYKKITVTSENDGSDKYDVGNYRITEPETLEDGMAIVYETDDLGKGRLTYKKITASETSSDSTKVGTVEVDETDKAEGKVLTYENDKLVYKALPTIPDNLPEIDDTDKAEGKILALQNDGKLGYVDMPTGSSEGGSATNNGQKTFNLVSPDGLVKGQFRADSKNAVTIDYSGDTYTLTLDRSQNVQMIQFVTNNMIDKVLYINTEFTDGKKWSWQDGSYFDMPIPLISYIQVNGNQLQKTTSGSYGVDDCDKFKITSLNQGYRVFVKMLY